MLSCLWVAVWVCLFMLGRVVYIWVHWVPHPYWVPFVLWCCCHGDVNLCWHQHELASDCCQPEWDGLVFHWPLVQSSFVFIQWAVSMHTDQSVFYTWVLTEMGFLRLGWCINTELISFWSGWWAVNISSYFFSRIMLAWLAGIRSFRALTILYKYRIGLGGLVYNHFRWTWSLIPVLWCPG